MARARGANRGAEALTEARSHQGEARSADEHDCADTVKELNKPMKKLPNKPRMLLSDQRAARREAYEH